MSILDPAFSSSEEILAELEAAEPLIEQMLKKAGLDQNNRVKLLRAGYSPKDILAVTDDEMEALFEHACEALCVGNLQVAKNMFTMLRHLDSLDGRFPYALGSLLQLQKQYSAAGKMYINALALNAKHVDAYVRLGECMVLAGEADEAIGPLEMAICLAGNGDGDSKIQARALLAKIADRSACA